MTNFTTRAPIPWPDGKTCAAAITFDMDADSLIHTVRPEDSHRRLYAISMGRYGPTVAIPRILKTYRRLGLRQSFFMPAWCMKQYPQAVEAVLEGGHEIGHHSFLHHDPVAIPDEEEARLFEKALDVHVAMTGRKPRGYRAPVYNVTQEGIDRLVAHGFLYDSSMMADDVPYLLDTPGGTLWEMPVHWGNDDWPPFAHYEEIGYLMPVRAPSDGLRAFVEEFEAAHATGGLWLPVLHPFLTGRLARWRAMERFLEDVLERDDVWFATLEEIAQHMDELRQTTPGAVRTETLPYYDGPVGAP